MTLKSTIEGLGHGVPGSEMTGVGSAHPLLHQLDERPRVRLLDGPTPLAEAPRLAERLGLERLLIKRDDLAASTFADNKLRKLEYILGAALDQGCDTIVTGGWVHANHARQTALHCARLGLDCVALIKGDDEEDCPSLRLFGMLGTKVVRAPSSLGFEEREAWLAELVEDARRRGARPYFCALGGTEPLGTLGSLRGALELEDQLAEAGVTEAIVFTASASGGTHAGLIAGSLVRGSRTRAIGISATKESSIIEGFTRRALSDLFGLVDSAGSPPGLRVEVDDSLARPSAHARRLVDEAIAVALRTESMLLDPLYTAKALAVLSRRARDGAWGPRPVPVLYHTGGTVGYFCH